MVSQADDQPVTLVCGRIELGAPLMMADNLVKHCDAGCGHRIQYRPNAKGSKHICLQCFAIEYDGGPVDVPQEAIDEVNSFFKRKAH